jgi:hypothetical protein
MAMTAWFASQEKTMSGANRIKGKGRLTPAKTLRFTFDGKVLHRRSRAIRLPPH